MAAGIVELTDAVEREGQPQHDRHGDGDVADGLVERRPQEIDGFAVQILVHPDGRELARRQCTQDPGFHRLDRDADHRSRLGGVSGKEVVLGRLEAPQRGVAAESDCQVDQFGGGGRRPPGACGVGGLVERGQHLLVGASRGQRQVPRPELRLGLELAERSVHGTAHVGSGVGVHAAGQQGMGEADPVSLEGDDALGFGLLNPLNQVGGGEVVGGREQLHRGFGHTRDAEQQVAGVVVEQTDPPAHQVGEGRRQGQLGARGPVVDGAAQLEGEKRVAAGDLGDAQHRRTGERAPQAFGDHGVQLPGVQRTHRGAVQPVGAVQMQPGGGRSVSGLAALGDQHAERTPQAAHGELDGGTAGAVQPLRVVDRHDHR